MSKYVLVIIALLIVSYVSAELTDIAGTPAFLLLNEYDCNEPVVTKVSTFLISTDYNLIGCVNKGDTWDCRCKDVYLTFKKNGTLYINMSYLISKDGNSIMRDRFFYVDTEKELAAYKQKETNISKLPDPNNTDLEDNPKNNNNQNNNNNQQTNNQNTNSNANTNTILDISKIVDINSIDIPTLVGGILAVAFVYYLYNKKKKGGGSNEEILVRNSG